jgi:hypothetical protein
VVARIVVRMDELVVEIEAINQIWALRCLLEIPLAHVVGAAIDPTISEARQSNPANDAERLHVLDAATFVQKEDRIEWGVADPRCAIVITLTDSDYPRLVVQVDDPEAAVAKINESVALHRAVNRDVQ